MPFASLYQAAPTPVSPAAPTSSPAQPSSGFASLHQLAATQAAGPSGTPTAPYDAPQLPQSLSWLQGAVDFANAGANSGMKHVSNVLSLLPGKYGDQFKQFANSIPEPQGAAEKAGSEIESVLEYAAPTFGVGKAVEGAPLMARMAAQGATNAGIAAAQSGGNKTSTITAGALGAGGELLGAGIKLIADAKAAIPVDYESSFAATPSQKPIIGRYVETLKRDGIPAVQDPGVMADLIKSRLAQISDQYTTLKGLNLDKREMDPTSIIDALKAQQDAYKRGSVISASNKTYHDNISKEIKDVENLAEQNGGMLNFGDLRYLRDGANGRTNFNSPEADQSLYRETGNIYRRAMDSTAPETTPINKDYATYKNLERIIDKNVSMGRGGNGGAFEGRAGHYAGAVIGGAIGRTTGVPLGGEVGVLLGSEVFPKLAGVTAKMLKHSATYGALKTASEPIVNAVRMMAQSGDNRGVLSLLKGLGTEEASQSNK